MDFLADENFPLVSIRLLRNAGHNVVSVIEATPGGKDRDVLKRAHEENRVVLTFDKDYGELISAQGICSCRPCIFPFQSCHTRRTC